MKYAIPKNVKRNVDCSKLYIVSKVFFDKVHSLSEHSDLFCLEAVVTNKICKKYTLFKILSKIISCDHFLTTAAQQRGI